jgi:uncharacterized RDD family membrane protein YckC
MKKTKRSARKPLVLANWGRRFIAWFVDYLIVNVMLAYVGLEQLETTIVPQVLLPRLPGFDISLWSPISILVFFIYWTLSSWYFGRSIGQLLVNVRLVDLNGRGVSLKAAAVQSFGKSLLLPLDCAVGWILRPCRDPRQKLFNKLSNTIVIYIGQPNRIIKQGEYHREP